MDELGPEARALLDAAREGLSPDPAAIRRVHGKIHAAAAGAAVGTALGVKVGIAGVVAAIAIGGGLYLRRTPAAQPASLPSIELASPTERPERAAARETAPPSDEDLITIEPSARSPVPAAGAPALPRVAASAVRDAHGAATETTRSRSAPGKSPGATVGATDDATSSRAMTGDAHRAAAPTAPAGIELSREVALIDLAMAALRRDDAAAALRVVQEYAAEAGEGGQLRQDAAAIEIEALCKLGDASARDKRTAFDARFPHSAQRARLEAACR